MSDPILTRKEGSVGIIELARPEKFNCLSLAVYELVDSARQRFEADGSVRSMLLRGQGKNFCTGADLPEVERTLRDAAALDRFIGFGMSVLLRLEASPLPVVAEVQGLCLAGGMELMLSADVCFAAETARFGDQHAQFGLIPGWGGSQRLTRIIGLRRTLDLMFSARWLTAHEALAGGLVNYVVPDDKLHETAFAYCEKMATRSRSGIAEMKRLAREGADQTLTQAMRLERDAVLRHFPGTDVAEGLDAFANRRQPKFSS